MTSLRILRKVLDKGFSLIFHVRHEIRNHKITGFLSKVDFLEKKTKKNGCTDYVKADCTLFLFLLKLNSWFSASSVEIPTASVKRSVGP